MSPCLSRVRASVQMKQPTKFPSATRLSYKEKLSVSFSHIVCYNVKTKVIRCAKGWICRNIVLQLIPNVRVQRSYKFKLYSNMSWLMNNHHAPHVAVYRIIYLVVHKKFYYCGKERLIFIWPLCFYRIMRFHSFTLEWRTLEMFKMLPAYTRYLLNVISFRQKIFCGHPTRTEKVNKTISCYCIP